jgi:hypothetical protein
MQTSSPFKTKKEVSGKQFVKMEGGLNRLGTVLNVQILILESKLFF